MTAAHALPHRVRLRPHFGFVVANTLFAAIFVALVLSMFHAPSPHGLPVGVVAPPAVTGQVEDALGRTAPGGFDLRVYRSEGAAATAVAHDEVDGALIASPGHLHLLIGRGGGAAPAQTLTTAFGAAAARAGQPLTVTDVVPPLTDDPMALSPFFVVLGVLFPSLAVGSASALVFRRARPVWCMAAPVLAAAVIGLVAAGIADGVSGLGNYAALAGIVALFSAAVATPTAVLGRIWPPLAALAVLVFVMFGIPASGGPSGLAAFGPGFLRVLHPALPLGAAASAVRAAVYFGGYGIVGPLWALIAWAAAGIAALGAVVAWRRRTPQALAVSRTVAANGQPGPQVALVVGFDDSKPAQRALSWAARFLAAHQGSLHVVYADRAIVTSDLSGFGHADMEADRDTEAAEVEQVAKAILAGSGVPFTFERRQGVPAEAILAGTSAVAAASGLDPVIVVGRSWHALHHVLGSVPVHLLHHSAYPVLTIP